MVILAICSENLSVQRGRNSGQHVLGKALEYSRRRFPSYSFPEDDLLSSLVELYFANVNIFLPLLHRPTFERSIRENLHMKDEMFGAVLLLVCAVASRYSNDIRVLLDGEESRHSSGWKWFDKCNLCASRSYLRPLYMICNSTV